MSGFRKFWLRIAKMGGLPKQITPHVLRHSFASLAGDLGYSESTIAALVGHKGRTITSRISMPQMLSCSLRPMRSPTAPWN
jgi:integrase